ncbi:MAG TPA: GAF domain-containing protein [Phycicoccus sp.]|nr:GAF domain-containing protein [Phycicoccus sp.]HQK30349.1 GAF domain-containing protein [Phycicoccus sp.]
MAVTHDADLRASVSAIRRLYSAAACSCALVNDEGSALRFVAASGEGADTIVGTDLPIGRGIAGWVAMSGQAIAVGDVHSDTRFARDIAEATHYVPTAIIAIPVLDPTGELLGVIEVLDPHTPEPTDRTLDVLGTLASQIGAFLALRGRHLDQGDETTTRLAALGRTMLEAARRYEGTLS